MIKRQELKKIYEESHKIAEEHLSPYACRNREAYRLREETRTRLRTDFVLDRDRILYSGSYRRYQGKTQVFSFSNMFDEEMTNRSLHTTYVSQISRTIGKLLRLNEDLIEAIALGHDLGHPPFGHDGEKALNDCCLKYGIGEFHHNIESLHIVDYIARRGNGLNLTFQVRDGILSHDGEVHNTRLYPKRTKKEQDLQNYIQVVNRGNKVENWMPANLEGCVVRITDTVAYIGQDIEDAIRFNILKREELPEDCAKYLGNRNSDIVDTLIKSVVQNSYEKDYVSFDEETSHYLEKLKKFNYERIYHNDNVKAYNDMIERSMALLFEKYMVDIEKENRDSKVFKHFLDNKSEEYLQHFSPPEQVRDFIATMTDRYFNEEAKDYLIPWK
ncbi:MAG: HD domain-containing protein [Candidatus Cloacimonetes bacterium]|nr:HD domain-containing protein [Candidatus Cloacimonadota bacterium]